MKEITKQIEKINSIADLDNKVTELISLNIDKFSYLIELKGYKSPRHSELIKYCFEQSISLREHIKKTIESYLQSQILEKGSFVDIEKEIDELLIKYESMEELSIGKVDFN